MRCRIMYRMIRGDRKIDHVEMAAICADKPTMDHYASLAAKRLAAKTGIEADVIAKACEIMNEHLAGDHGELRNRTALFEDGWLLHTRVDKHDAGDADQFDLPMTLAA